MSTAAPLRVIQISDFHLKTQPGNRLWGVDVDASLNAVLARVQLKHPMPDLVLATGDLVGDDPDAYHRVRDLMKPLGAPVYCLPGNHDFPAIMSRTLCEGPLRRERHVVVGGWQFILLDSSFPGTPDGHLGYGELALLDTVLVTHPDLYTVVCLHHNPVPSRTAWLDTMMVSNNETLFAILDRYPQVRAVVWGHIHAEFSDMRNSVRLLAAPATCVQFKPNTPEPQVDEVPPGYRWFELHADGTLHTGVERTEPLIRPNGLTRRIPA